MVDKTADYEQMLGELYYILQHYYYDEKHHKADWRAVYERYKPVLQQVREDQDFADYANLMIGELNSSHMGFNMPRTGRIDEPSAHVGAVWSFEGGKVILARLIKDGPLYDRRDHVAPGDELVAVDGAAGGPGRQSLEIFQRQTRQAGQTVIPEPQDPEDGRSRDQADLRRATKTACSSRNGSPAAATLVKAEDRTTRSLISICGPWGWAT